MAGLSFEHGSGSSADANRAFKKQLNKVYGWYTGGFIAFVVVLAIFEQMGLSREWIGFIFLLATVGLYAGIGIMSRTTDAAEYYVAGRRVPALYNGMATGADWMSAASFIGMAGTLYLTGYGGLAFIMGWTGGYCLVALFLAPYMPSSVSSRSPTSWGRASKATCRASSASSARSCAPSPTWWRRSTAWA
jgi:cation/acetate symporter